MTNPAQSPSAIIPFHFESHQLRAIERDGQPWFVAADVCEFLGLINDRNAVARLDADEKGVHLTDTLGGKQEINIVNESGLYSLILRCRRAATPGTPAHRFRKWVTSEVLPTIRKTGRYEAAPVIETISPQQHKQLTDAIGSVLRGGGWCLQYSNGAQDHIANRLRVTFNIQTLRDLPASQFEAAIIVINSLRPAVHEYLLLCGEIHDAFIRDMLGGGMPWTAWIKRTIGVELPRRPDWKKLAQDLINKRIAKSKTAPAKDAASV